MNYCVFCGAEHDEPAYSYETAIQTLDEVASAMYHGADVLKGTVLTEEAHTFADYLLQLALSTLLSYVTTLGEISDVDYAEPLDLVDEITSYYTDMVGLPQ